MNNTATSERILRFRVNPEVIAGKPVVAFGVVKTGGPVARWRALPWCRSRRPWPLRHELVCNRLG